MDLRKHPGYFGCTSQGVIAIHADWPTYPFEHGWQEALLAFGSFPATTHFVQVDDIDHCFLFVAGAPAPRHSHVAAWHEDIVELVNRKYIDGVELVGENEVTWEQWNRFKDLQVEVEPGRFVRLNFPEPKYDEDCFPGEKRIPVCSQSGLQIAMTGIAALRSLLISELANAPKTFLELVEPILAIYKTDTAVREACVLLETLMRNKIKSSNYGQKLVDEFCDRLLKNGSIPRSLSHFEQS